MTREEAIKVASEIHGWLKTDREREALETLIPELTESEDERIRTELLSSFKGIMADADEDELWYGLPYNDIIAWLEKQKEQKPWKVGANAYFTPEQKPVEYLSKRKVYDIMNKLTELSTSDLIPIESEEYVKIHEITHDVRDLLNYPIEQKPAEWDEYTKTNLDRALQIIKKAKGTLQGYQSDDGIYECDKAIECLEHFLYRGLEMEKLAEWSEEDRDILLQTAAILKANFDSNEKFEDCDYDCETLAGKLLEMRYRISPSWKPSKEQMKALEDAFRKDGSDEYRKTINSLYQDLKKLM